MEPSKSAVFPRDAQKNTFSMFAKSAKTRRGRKMYQKNTPYVELLQFSLKEDLVNNGYFLFAEEVISNSQYAEEFIKSFQSSLVATLSRF